MNTDVQETRELNDLSRAVIGAAFEVANQLGPGFLEQVYELSLCRELTLRHVPVERQKVLPIAYKGVTVASYIADVLVDERLLVELKCVESLRSEHVAQCINYLAATRLKVCLLINFHKPKVEWKRVVREL